MSGHTWMTHAELIEAVNRRCKKLGLRVFHHPDSRRATDRGWPDLTIFGVGRLIYREVKTTRDDLRPDQRLVGSMLLSCAEDWAVWRPRDLMDGTIERQLTRISGEA